jgi:surfactin synthase thioesterase subunit
MITLFCLPHAGGSAANYYQWNRYLGKTVDLRPIELHGRGSKMRLPFHKNMSELVDCIFNEVSSQVELGSNYAIFGHSFGSWIAYELYSRICDRGLQEPKVIFFSGLRPPYAEGGDGLPDSLDDEDILKTLRYFGGTEEIVFENETMRTFYLSVLKADFNIIRDYQGTRHEKLITCEAFALSGKEDHTVKNADLFAWKEVCASRFGVRKISGDHFYTTINARETVGFINSVLGS